MRKTASDYRSPGFETGDLSLFGAFQNVVSRKLHVSSGKSVCSEVGQMRRGGAMTAVPTEAAGSVIPA